MLKDDFLKYVRQIKHNRRELILNIILVFMSIMLVVAGAEAYLRVGMGLQPGDYPESKICAVGDEKKQAALGDGAKFHPEYGWISRPNRTLVSKHNIFEDWDTYSTNSRGFRDNYDRGNSSVIILGDSFTYGAIAGNNETYPYLLDRWNKDVSVHNYGISGYGTAQEMLLYEDVGENIKHDLVILGYVSNDPRNNMGITTKGDIIPSRPIFSIENGTLVQSHKPEAKLTGSRNTPETALSGLPTLQKLNTFLSKRSSLHRFLAPTFQSILSKAGVLNPSYATDYEPKVNQRMRLTRELLNQISNEAEANGAQLVIVPIPPNEVARQTSAMRYAGNKTYWNLQKRVIKSVARSNSNVDTLDIQPEVRARIDGGDQLYGPRNGHFNEQGYKLMAKQIQQNYFDNDISEEKLKENYGRHSKKCPA
jgi:lysophospholipase L1-like esterase